jgi:hypothetical protein
MFGVIWMDDLAQEAEHGVYNILSDPWTHFGVSNWIHWLIDMLCTYLGFGLEFLADTTSGYNI